jgi:hypothetical protein
MKRGVFLAVAFVAVAGAVTPSHLRG